MSKRKLFLVGISLLLFSYEGMSNNAVSSLGDCFRELHKRLSAQATSKIASLSIDSADHVFSVLLKNNAPISKVFRINSNGIIINESTQENKNHVMRNISGQKWFIEVRTTGKPYYAVTRDSSTVSFLFWVWPLNNAEGQFSGALAAKIDPSRMVQYVDEKKSLPLKIVTNNNTVYINKWQGIENVESIKWEISKSLIITGFYKSPNTVITDEKEVKEAHPVKNPTVKSSKTDTTISVSESHTGKTKKLRAILLIILFAVVMVVIFFRVGKRWQPDIKDSKSKQKDRSQESSNDSPEEVLALVDEHLAEEGEAVKAIQKDDAAEVQSSGSEKEKEKENFSLTDNSCIEEHQKKGPVSIESFYNQIKGEIFKKAAPHFKPAHPIHSTDEEMRLHDELYQEIHGQIIHWVISESARLSSSLEELNTRINRIEGINNPELDSIREDALRISKEIEIFKKNFPPSQPSHPYD